MTPQEPHLVLVHAPDGRAAIGRAAGALDAWTAGDRLSIRAAIAADGSATPGPRPVDVRLPDLVAALRRSLADDAAAEPVIDGSAAGDLDAARLLADRARARALLAEIGTPAALDPFRHEHRAWQIDRRGVTRADAGTPPPGTAPFLVWVEAEG